LVVGGGNGIGRDVALLLARRGAHVVITDVDGKAAEDAATEAIGLSTPDQVAFTVVDLSSQASIADAIKFTIRQFGGVDIVVNTAAIYPVPGRENRLTDTQWAQTFQVNVTGNYLLAEETKWVFADQNLPGAMVLVSSANAVAPKKDTEAYDTSKAAVNHLIRELAIELSPSVRVNGIAPATVVAGSNMFPRDRVIHSLRKYSVPFSEFESTEELRGKLAHFYARRTLIREPILPRDCAQAILWLAGDESAKTTGHIIPVDGGLPDAFLR